MGIHAVEIEKDSRGDSFCSISVVVINFGLVVGPFALVWVALLELWALSLSLWSIVDSPGLSSPVLLLDFLEIVNVVYKGVFFLHVKYINFSI